MKRKIHYLQYTLGIILPLLALACGGGNNKTTKISGELDAAYNGSKVLSFVSNSPPVYQKTVEVASNKFSIDITGTGAVQLAIVNPTSGIIEMIQFKEEANSSDTIKIGENTGELNLGKLTKNVADITTLKKNIVDTSGNTADNATAIYKHIKEEFKDLAPSCSVWNVQPANGTTVPTGSKKPIHLWFNMKIDEATFKDNFTYDGTKLSETDYEFSFPEQGYQVLIKHKKADFTAGEHTIKVPTDVKCLAADNTKKDATAFESKFTVSDKSQDPAVNFMATKAEIGTPGTIEITFNEAVKKETIKYEAGFIELSATPANQSVTTKSIEFKDDNKIVVLKVEYSDKINELILKIGTKVMSASGSSAKEKTFKIEVEDAPNNP